MLKWKKSRSTCQSVYQMVWSLHVRLWRLISSSGTTPARCMVLCAPSRMYYFKLHRNHVTITQACLLQTPWHMQMYYCKLHRNHVTIAQTCLLQTSWHMTHMRLGGSPWPMQQQPGLQVH
jgi:hypothetical protein